jgi:hypothetical protein
MWLVNRLAPRTESNSGSVPLPPDQPSKGARMTLPEQQFGPTRVGPRSGPAKEVAGLAYYLLLTTYSLLLTPYY